jgi:luciferase family oxidoreductase group 1
MQAEVVLVTELTLGVVDQSPIQRNGKAVDALQKTIDLAQAVEKMGYHRYWVAEHHSSGGFAGTAPEILIGQIAARTNRIHVGSGGVMLTHYSAFKVAEVFSMLEALHPGRIDLGIGRAPGSDQLTAAALAYPKGQVDVGHFPQQVVDVLGHLSGTMDTEHPFVKLKVQPGQQPETVPEIWLLGSSDYSARLAAEIGMPFSFADFFGHTTDHGPVVTEMYRRQFKPSGYLSEPKLNVTVQVMCADSEERAQFIASSRNLSKLNSMMGNRGGFIPPEEASMYQANDAEQQILGNYMKGYVDGDPQQVHAKLLAVSERYATTDINIVTNCYYFADRVRSYELVAEAFGMINPN